MRLWAMVVVVLGGSVWAQSPETRDANASSALKPEAGGPSTIGDPVRINDLSISHDETDFVINTALGSFSLERKFSSSTTWKDSLVRSAWYGFNLQTRDNIQRGWLSWWSSLSAYAVEYSWGLPGKDAEPGKVVDIRDTSGDLYQSGNLFEKYIVPPQTFPTTTGAARIVRIVTSGTTASRLMLVKPGVGKTEFEFVETTSADNFHFAARFRLKAIYPDIYATTSFGGPTDMGQPICTFEYPDSTPWQMSAIHCVGGVELRVNWNPPAGLAPATVATVTEAAAPSNVLVSYGYTTPTPEIGPQLSRVDNFSSGQTTLYTPFAAQTTGNFTVQTGALGAVVGGDAYTVTSKVLGVLPVCGAKSRAVASESDLNGSISYSPAGPGLPACDPGDVNNTTAERMPSGDTVTRVFTRAPSGGTTKRIQQSCNGCSSMRATSMEWFTDSSLPTPTDLWRVNTQGEYNVTRAGRVCHPDLTCADATSFRDTEVWQRLGGATDASGSNALADVSATYIYNNAHEMYEQLLDSITTPSVLGTGGVATLFFRYDGLTKRPLAIIRRGNTNDINGVALTRFVGTFFFNRAVSSNGEVDPFDRVVETHGPCLVTSAASTDCDVAGAAIPLVRYTYYPWGINGGRVASKSVSPNYFGGASGTARWLTTTYAFYDLRGHVLRETDANGAVTERVYVGDRLTSEVVSHAPSNVLSQTLYFYHPSQGGMLSSKRLPSGMWERYCYRAGASVAPDCLSGGMLTPRLQWVARVVAAGTAEPSGALAFVEKTTSTYASGSQAQPLGGVLLKTVNESMASGEANASGLRYDALGRVVASQKLNRDGTVVNESHALFDEEGRQLADGTPYSNSSVLCGGMASWDGSCAHLGYDRLGRVSYRIDPDWSWFSFAYDAQGNLGQVSRDGSSGPMVTYGNDDFGHKVTVAGQWMEGKSSRRTFDAAGNMKQYREPGGALIEYAYDGMGRVVEQRANGALVVSTGYDEWATTPSGCSTTSFAQGRVRVRNDTFGASWYEYNGVGQLTAIRRIRAGAANVCSGVQTTDSSNTTPDSRFVYSTDGRLLKTKYPHGRWLFYSYGGAGASGQDDKITDIATNVVGDSGDKDILLSSIRYTLGGRVLSYWLPPSPTRIGGGLLGTNVRYSREGSATPGQPCGTVGHRDSSGDFSSVSVSRTVGYVGLANVFSRTYSWQGDQLSAESTCILDEVNPRTVTYGNDLELRVTQAGRSPVDQQATRGGQLAGRQYQYSGGLRSFAQCSEARCSAVQG
jgi:YD repeat-containing protein